jgi:hypothetical protein
VRAAVRALRETVALAGSACRMKVAP